MFGVLAACCRSTRIAPPHVVDEDHDEVSALRGCSGEGGDQTARHLSNVLGGHMIRDSCGRCPTAIIPVGNLKSGIYAIWVRPQVPERQSFGLRLRTEPGFR